MLVHARVQEFRTDPPPHQRPPARAPRTRGGEGESQRSRSGQTRGGHWHERTRDIAVKPRQPNPAAQEPKRGQPDKNLEAAPWNIDHAPSNPERQENRQNGLDPRVDHRRSPSRPLRQHGYPQQGQGQHNSDQCANQRSFKMQGRHVFHQMNHHDTRAPPDRSRTCRATPPLRAEARAGGRRSDTSPGATRIRSL